MVSVHLYCYYQLQPRVISNDFHWLKWDEYVTRNGIPLSGDTLFPRACAALIIAVSWVWPLGGREFGRWSRQRLFSNILSDPVQIRCTLTSWLKAWSKSNFGFKKFWVRKNFGSKKMLVEKNYWSKKIVGPKKFESAKYFELKNFGPPFLRQRVKYGGLDK